MKQNVCQATDNSFDDCQWKLETETEDEISCYATNVQVAGTLVMITDLTVNIIALKVCSDHSDC